MWDGHISVVNTAGIWKGPTLPSRDKTLATHAAHSFVALRCRKVRKKQIRRMYLTYPGMWTPYPLCFVSILQAQWALEDNTTARFLKWQELPVGRAVLGPCCSGDGALEHEWSQSCALVSTCECDSACSQDPRDIWSLGTLSFCPLGQVPLVVREQATVRHDCVSTAGKAHSHSHWRLTVHRVCWHETKLNDIIISHQ